MRAVIRGAACTTLFHLLDEGFMSDRAPIDLARLLLISDSSFPTGTFAHSWGLEHAVRFGDVKSAGALATWAEEALRFGVGPLDGQALLRASELGGRVRESASSSELASSVAQELRRLSDEWASFVPSREARNAAGQVGRSLLRAARKAFPSFAASAMATAERAASGDESRVAQPVAWGFVCGVIGIPPIDQLEAYLLGTLRQWSQVAMRMIPIGQSDALSVVGALLANVAAISSDIVEHPAPFTSITPGWDVALLAHAAMSTRYFRS